LSEGISEVQALMGRPWETLRAAEALVRQGFPDDAASRAYYAAFYAASALHADQGRVFGRHTGVRASLHRDVVRNGLLDPKFGKDYDSLWNLRNVGDYGRTEHVSLDMSHRAVGKAREFVEAVSMLLDRQEPGPLS